jgi:hypothetical protein
MILPDPSNVFVACAPTPNDIDPHGRIHSPASIAFAAPFSAPEVLLSFKSRKKLQLLNFSPFHHQSSPCLDFFHHFFTIFIKICLAIVSPFVSPCFHHVFTMFTM